MRILRLLSSRPLPCGCLAGIYETYDGPIARVVDARDPRCHDPGHRLGATLNEGEGVDVISRPQRVPSDGLVH